ncbi:MAG: hypothetical protein PHV34_07495 [Verrucomicrobiae bacterium]|nr:hypothetical protein [Verrucomicrobiae bacterium]
MDASKTTAAKRVVKAPAAAKVVATEHQRTERLRIAQELATLPMSTQPRFEDRPAAIPAEVVSLDQARDTTVVANAPNDRTPVQTTR